MAFVAPLNELNFVMTQLADLAGVQALAQYQDASSDIIAAVLAENAKLAETVIAPLNHKGDKNPPVYTDGQVRTSSDFKTAFAAYVQGGWQGLKHSVEYGGQGLPKLLACACLENINAASLSFGLCPLLTDGAIEALLTAASDELKQRYLAPLVAGRWTGTMELTEPQAGSDLSLIRSYAQQQSDGTYRLFGQKIFITYGEHDLTDNILHFVLARTPDAPPGIKGISLFLVPKFLLDEHGELAQRNDVWCASVEHKLGIKASPTAVMLYGENKGQVGTGAVAYLIGQEHHGLEYMFIMMNAARFAVGVQGVAVSERAYQRAYQYAHERVQSRPVTGGVDPVAIIQHPDVARMLLNMRALTQGARATAYVAAMHSDMAQHHADPLLRAQHQANYEYLVPIVKGFSTEIAVKVCSTGIQVHGGMGFIEETGAAQHYRDARILPIYEGTTAIQANDLLSRKTMKDQGQVAYAFIEQMRATQLALKSYPQLQGVEKYLAQSIDDYETVIQHLVLSYQDNIKQAFACSVPYLMLAGYVHAGWHMARAGIEALAHLGQESVDGFYHQKLQTVQFYATHILPKTHALRVAITQSDVSYYP